MPDLKLLKPAEYPARLKNSTPVTHSIQHRYNALAERSKRVDRVFNRRRGFSAMKFIEIAKKRSSVRSYNYKQAKSCKRF